MMRPHTRKSHKLEQSQPSFQSWHWTWVGGAAADQRMLDTLYTPSWPISHIETGQISVVAHLLGDHLASGVQGDVAQPLRSGPAGHGGHCVGPRGAAVEHGVPPQVLEHEGGQALLQLALHTPQYFGAGPGGHELAWYNGRQKGQHPTEQA